MGPQSHAAVPGVSTVVTSVAPDASDPGIVVRTPRFSDERVFKIARRVAQIAVGIHVVDMSVHLVLVVERKHGSLGRGPPTEIPMAVAATIVVSFVGRSPADPGWLRRNLPTERWTPK